MRSRATASLPRDRRPLDEAIRSIPSEWFRPRPAIYWTDLLTCVAIGWSSFAVVLASTARSRILLLPVALFALYRAVLFIHELTHLNARDVPGFKTVWNVLVGVPFLIPSFVYEGVHTDHHRQNSYATAGDPEYVPYGRRTPALILGSAILSLLAPIAFALRFGLLAPLSYFVPAVRRFTLAHASALAINPAYVRRVPIGVTGRVQELAAAVVVWTIVWLWRVGVVPSAAIGYWCAAIATASAVNAYRTFAAHRYDHEPHELSSVEQLLDSVTIAPSRQLADVARALVAPVGLRYHALHHWIPSLPYHNLGRVHRLLLARAAPDAPYRQTIADGFLPVVRDLVRRSRGRGR